MKKQLLIFVSLVLFTAPLLAQKKWPPLRVYAGMALGAQDRRLFDYPQADILLRRDKKLDRTFNVSVEADLWSWRRFGLSAGVGYSVQNTRFIRPYFPFFSPMITGNLRFVERYSISQIMLPVTATYYLDKSERFGIQVATVNNIAFRKRFTREKSGWDLHYKSFDIYPGVVVRLTKHLSFEASYRAYYLNHVDPYIITPLFRGNVPKQYQDGFETYNPTTLWFRLGYTI
jgi:hypothetical protein